jgi:hypothetical protein
MAVAVAAFHSISRNLLAKRESSSSILQNLHKILKTLLAKRENSGSKRRSAKIALRLMQNCRLPRRNWLITRFHCGFQSQPSGATELQREYSESVGDS